MNRWTLSAAAAALLVTGSACANLGEDRLLGVSATSTIEGLVYFDFNGNRSPDAGDDSVRNLRISLVEAGSNETVATALTDIRGVYSIDSVPVGTYRIVVDTVPLLDTAVIDRIDSSEVSLVPGDTTRVDVVISYPRVSIAQARTLPLGRKVFIEGLVLNPLNNFRDTTIHVQDTSAALRATRVFNIAVAPGDSVRMRGTISRRPLTGSPQPTLDLVTVFSIGQRFLPPAAVLTAAAAASAQAGTRDAQLVQVLNVTISDTATVGPDFRLTVNDASGTLEVLLDAVADAAFQPPGPTPPANYEYKPGNRFDIVGVLVPTGQAGIWRLKPRSAQDLLRL